MRCFMHVRAKRRLIIVAVKGRSSLLCMLARSANSPVKTDPTILLITERNVVMEHTHETETTVALPTDDKTTASEAKATWF